MSGDCLTMEFTPTTVNIDTFRTETREVNPDYIAWMHIQGVFERCSMNISEAGRRLGIHRRTLQRMFGKNPPPRYRTLYN